MVKHTKTHLTMLKNIFPFVISGAIGGLVVLAGLHFNHNADQEIKINQPVSNVSYTGVGGGNIPASFAFAAEKTMPSVVHIRAKESEQTARQRRYNNSPFGDEFFWGFGQPRAQEGTGSGVIISPDGYIVTNNHVVDFADLVEVTLHDERKFKATVVGRDPKSDLAVIKIDEDNLPTIEFGNSDNIKVGEWVLAVGNPFNLNSTVTAGIISAKHRKLDVIPEKDALEAFIQTDAAVNPGNSGGALVDPEGKLIGLNSAIASPTGSYAGYSFAIPVNLLRRIVDDLIQYGNVKKGSLGVMCHDIDDGLIREYNLKVKEGMFVNDVIKGSSAQTAGILPSDVIVAIEGKKIQTFDDLRENIALAKVGQVISVTVNRNGQNKVIPVKLKAGS